MKEHSILFSGPMVRAIREGRKTQTRRPIKHPEYFGCLTGDCPHMFQAECDAAIAVWAKESCPYGVPGDRLWVRETFAVFCVTDYSRGDILNSSAQVGIGYRADHKTGNLADGDGGYNFRPVEGDDRIAQARLIAEDHYHEWRPSIHMPRWASRLTLEITDVRVQRVQEITEEDSRAEGAYLNGIVAGDARCGTRDYWHFSEKIGGNTAKDGFEHLWESINAKRGFGWDSNPWAWALTFKCVEVSR